MLRPGSWSRPAGGSPVRVSTGAPGSRGVETPVRLENGGLSGASRASLEGASTRAVALSEPCSLVKRTMEEPSRSCHGEGHVRWARSEGSAHRVLPGYGGWHVCMVWAGTGETLLRHAFRQARDQAYLPMVKSPGGQRESEGAVVLVSGVQHNAPGGKGPHFDHAVGGGKRQGMAGTARSNSRLGRATARTGEEHTGSPVGWVSSGNVRQLQRRLWAAAKQSPERRFHALFEPIWGRPVGGVG